MNRRAFLKALVDVGALAPAMAALGGLPLTGVAAAETQPGGMLDADESALLEAVIARMVETGVEGAPTADEVGAAGAVEGVLAHLDPELVEQLRLALWLVDWWPAVGELRFARFRSLPSQQQDESLEGWRTSRLDSRRLVFHALRNLSMLGYWSQDQTWELIGYGGPWIGRRG